MLTISARLVGLLARLRQVPLKSPQNPLSSRAQQPIHRSTPSVSYAQMLGNHVVGGYPTFNVADTAQRQVQVYEMVDVTNRAVWSWTTSVLCCLSGPFHGERLKLLGVTFTWPYTTSLCIPRVSFLCRTVVNSTSFQCRILHNLIIKVPSRTQRSTIQTCLLGVLPCLHAYLRSHSGRHTSSYNPGPNNAGIFGSHRSVLPRS